MNLEIFKRSDPSGMFSRESYILKHYPEEYYYITNYCTQRNIIDLPFKEKVYIAINNLESIPKCKNPNCENKVNYKNSTLGYYTYCSNKCMGSDPDMIICKEKKSLEKFGTKAPSQSSEIKNKIIKTNNDRYGANSAMCLTKTQEKSKKTLLENWGVDNPNKSKEISNKRINSFKENIKQYRESYKKKSLEKYGTEHPWMNEEIHNKTVESQIETKKLIFLDILNNRLDSDPDEYKIVEIDFKASKRSITLECNLKHTFTIDREVIKWRQKSKSKLCTICNPIKSGISGQEILIREFIQNNYDGEIVLNSRKIITPYEADIYIPNLKLAIEYNGLYWHSEDHKDNDYHEKKFKIADDNGISLITIWEDDWLYKTDIVKSFILNKLNKTKNRIYARNCQVREIKYEESMNFLNNNHLQGDIKSPVRIGLFYNDKLVSLMTFSKLRIALSQRNTDDSVYELTRFCNLINHNIIGGASKLLKYFIKNYNPSQIHSYSDNMISTGNLYKSLGFNYSHSSKAGYWYVIDGIRSHRFNWRKSKLVDMGHDKDKTESEIMSEMGYFRVYGAGNKKWILNI